MKKNNKRIKFGRKMYDPETTKIASLALFDQSDKENNKLKSQAIRATHTAYIVGEIKVRDLKPIFVDTVSDNLDEYLYFTNLVDAYLSLPEDYDGKFVVNDNSLYRYGIFSKLPKDELIKVITSKMKAHFNFQDEDEEYKKVKIK